MPQSWELRKTYPWKLGEKGQAQLELTSSPYVPFPKQKTREELAQHQHIRQQMGPRHPLLR